MAFWGGVALGRQFMLMHLKFRGERAKSGRGIAPVGVAVAVADASPHFITCIISPWDRARPHQATIESSVVDRRVLGRVQLGLHWAAAVLFI